MIICVKYLRLITQKRHFKSTLHATGLESYSALSTLGATTANHFLRGRVAVFSGSSSDGISYKYTPCSAGSTTSCFSSILRQRVRARTASGELFERLQLAIFHVTTRHDDVTRGGMCGGRDRWPRDVSCANRVVVDHVFHTSRKRAANGCTRRGAKLCNEIHTCSVTMMQSVAMSSILWISLRA